MADIKARIDQRLPVVWARPSSAPWQPRRRCRDREHERAKYALVLAKGMQLLAKHQHL